MAVIQRRCCIVFAIVFIFFVITLFYTHNHQRFPKINSIIESIRKGQFQDNNVSEMIDKAIRTHNLYHQVQDLQSKSEYMNEIIKKLSAVKIEDVARGVISKYQFKESISKLNESLFNMTELINDLRKMTITKSSSTPSTSNSDTRTLSTKPTYSFESFHAPLKSLSMDFAKRMKQVKAFEVQITLSERHMMYDLLRVFHETCNASNISYMMYGGTLLGSYRHHDLVPWDDDLDVLLAEAERKHLREVFKKLEPKYTLKAAGPHDKIYRNDGFNSNAYSWKWPYVDVSYYKENDTHIWDIASPYGQRLTFPKSITFPLHLRPLYNLSLFAPNDSFATLLWTIFSGDQCRSYGYSHIVEGGGPAGQISCRNLGNRFPFVKRLPDSNGVREILRWKNQVISDIVVDEPRYAVSAQYSLSLMPGFTVPPDVDVP